MVCLRFFESFRSQGIGRAGNVFDTIKTLPNKQDYNAIKISNEFEKRLMAINNRKVNLAFRRFKNGLNEGQSVKSN